MQQDKTVTDARAIMLDFANGTGLTNPEIQPRRYLWTDAHAVCNFLSLYTRTRDEEYRALAQQLIDQVHHVLGKHRDDDPRQGWISGLSDSDGEGHPTAGGLRIGKELNERGVDDRLDERLEWDRDGQYYHYLTKWMHALYKAGVVTRKPEYCRWAIELAKAAHAGFARAIWPDGRKRLVWKMSIDLTYPLVPSSGLHDPLDGYVTYNELGLCPDAAQGGSRLPDLDTEIAETAGMNDDPRWASDDPLGIGGLLFDACRVCQLIAVSRLDTPDLAANLLRDIKRSLASFAGLDPLRHPAASRLAFRELGLSIGLRAVELMRSVTSGDPDRIGDTLRQDIAELAAYESLGEAIENFWREGANQRARTWIEHRDINSVMLATSLLPDEFLRL